MKYNESRPECAGFTAVEMIISAVILAMLLFATVEGFSSQSSMLEQSAESAQVKRRTQELLEQLEVELPRARGANPRALATIGVDGAAAAVQVDTLRGLPPSGALLLQRGTASTEYARYTSLFATGISGMTRGISGTTGQNLPVDGEIFWAGLAEPIEDQTAPAAALFDGVSAEFTGPVFFRGAGLGFSYQVPIDPAGGNDYLIGGTIRWGAEVDGARIVNGWHAVQFDPRGVVTEAVERTDLNGDGDLDDQFDLGQLQKITWNAMALGAPPRIVDMGPSTLLQEQGNWGGDLNGDGSDDPLFLWDAVKRRLSVKFSCLARTEGSIPLVHRASTVIFLRNDPTP